MVEHIDSVLPLRSTRTAGWLALLLSCVLIPTTAYAQDYTPPEGSFYFSTFWLIMLLLYCVEWLGVVDWVGKDAEKIKLRHDIWAGLALGIGAVGAMLFLMAHIALIFVGIAGLGVLFGIYVYRRNQIVPASRRIFTKSHFQQIMLQLGAKFKLVPKEASQRIQSGATDQGEIKLLRKDGASLQKIADGRQSAGLSEAVRSVNELIESAVLSRATDIHLEPKEGELQARFRIDGILHNVPSYPLELASPMTSSIKVLSDMDITERRKPQDGTFRGRLPDRDLDFRVSTAPSVYGETLVIRILDRSAGLISLEKLGFTTKDMERARKVMNYPHGMMVVSGPTGAGKTTTLYAMLSEIDAYQKNILTIEDPIEYKLENVTQTQVNPKAEVTFASALRSALRQDPDVMMVGEIRDAETARVALQAAMTGHLVFTTIHANDAVTSLFRLLDLGVEPYLIASSLSAILAQRLARQLCSECKEAYLPEPAFLAKIGVRTEREIHLYKNTGCDICQGTGFYGRMGLFELLEVNDVIRDLIRTNPSVQLIKAEARKCGMRSMQEDGLIKVIKGLTSVQELARVTRA